MLTENGRCLSVTSSLQILFSDHSVNQSCLALSLLLPLPFSVENCRTLAIPHVCRVLLLLLLILEFIVLLNEEHIPHNLFCDGIQYSISFLCEESNRAILFPSHSLNHKDPPDFLIQYGRV